MEDGNEIAKFSGFKKKGKGASFIESVTAAPWNVLLTTAVLNPHTLLVPASVNNYTLVLKPKKTN